MADIPPTTCPHLLEVTPQASCRVLKQPLSCMLLPYDDTPASIGYLLGSAVLPFFSLHLQILGSYHFPALEEVQHSMGNRGEEPHGKKEKITLNRSEAFRSISTTMYSNKVLKLQIRKAVSCLHH